MLLEPYYALLHPITAQISTTVYRSDTSSLVILTDHALEQSSDRTGFLSKTDADMIWEEGAKDAAERAKKRVQGRKSNKQSPRGTQEQAEKEKAEQRVVNTIAKDTNVGMARPVRNKPALFKESLISIFG